MKTMSLFFLAALLLASPIVANAKPRQSDITFGRSEKLETTAAKKRNFKQDIVAVTKSHESWKKAHLNPALYSCQHNGERVASLAKQVADKIEASQKATTTQAKALEKTIAQAVGESETEMPETLAYEKAALLKAKVKELSAAQRNSQILERLSGQIMNFYVNDIPKQTSFGGNCTTAYPAALKNGVARSKQYHTDSEVLYQKLLKLSSLAKLALRNLERMSTVAAR